MTSLIYNNFYKKKQGNNETPSINTNNANSIKLLNINTKK